MSPTNAAPDHAAEGLAVDLPLLARLARPIPLVSRRRMLGLFGGAGAVAVLAACRSSSGGTSTGASSTAGSSPVVSSPVVSSPVADPTGTTTSVASAGVVTPGPEIPSETSGPFPGDGTNGPNALAESGVVRSDIRSSFGSSTTVAEGIPVTFELTVVEADSGAPLPGAAVYLWQCDRDGNYSLYSSGFTGENYLRGVQTADANGNLTFVSIFPGCYPGRWPHAHFEVYDSLDAATVGSNATKTSQLAIPASSCDEAYAAAGYESSVSSFARLSLASDNVFSDGVDAQLPTMSGNPVDGYTAALVIRV